VPVGDTVVVRGPLTPARATHAASVREHVRQVPKSVIIMGGGGAGLAAADMLRREGYDGPVTILSADDSPPVDRPNLSKDYLAGQAQDDWIPLRAQEFYTDQHIELVLGARVTAIDTKACHVHLEDGTTRMFGALLIATGAEPVHLPIPGADGPNVFYLRSFTDSKRIVERAGGAKRAVVIGASFIGLEVAASLRTRGLDVDVVGPETFPFERILGKDMGAFIRGIHEAHGVTFHLGQSVKGVDGRVVTLGDGSKVEGDFVVMGVGVRPAIAVAEQAGLKIDRGIAVDEYLETSTPGIFAAGDVARWPDPHSGERVRIEHWVVAERQGQAAARNILGAKMKFDSVPFFWSQHYDVTINYVGHAERWDAAKVDGDLNAQDCTVTYTLGNRTLAVATISRDLESLRAERAMEREPQLAVK
jgi:NADPH-dependent 2,4-dienoyl-CoA reductase/sulfur reductase-like enzyme